MKTNLLLTTDDYGVVPKINEAVINLVKNGIVNSVESFANYGKNGAKSVRNALKLINETKGINENFEIGIHLTITSGKPLKETAGLDAILTGKKGQKRFVDYRHLNSNAKPAAIYSELKRQINLLLKHPVIGPKVTHLTNHHDSLWFYRSYTEQLVKLSNELGLPIRNPVSVPASKTKIYYQVQNIARDIDRSDKKEIKEAYKDRKNGVFKGKALKFKAPEYMDSRHYAARDLFTQVSKNQVKNNLKRKKKKLVTMFKDARLQSEGNNKRNVVEFMFHVRAGDVLDPVNMSKDLSYYTGINTKYFDGRTMEYQALMEQKDYINKKLSTQFNRGSWTKTNNNGLKKG